MVKDDYEKVRKQVDDYFRLVRKLLTGDGEVPEHVLRRLKLQGNKIRGLIPGMGRLGASKFPDADRRKLERDLREQMDAAKIRTDLAMENLRTKVLAAAQSAIAASVGIAAGAAVFNAAADAVRRRRQEFRSDWNRTVKTEMQTAKEQGASSALMAYPDGDRTKVCKVCRADACAQCIAAYQNPDGTPKVFTIGELRANGTNAGRKAAEWLPVIGCMHPHCQCSLHIVT